MKHNSIIIKIDNLEQYKIGNHLKESLKDVLWRIQSNSYDELIAEVFNDIVIAIGMSWNNPNHPFAKYIYIAGTVSNELMNELLILQPPYDRIIFSCWENEQEKIQLIQQFQFQLFRKTFMENYTINDLLQKINEKDEPLLLVSLEQILKEPTLEEDLFKLLKYSYEHTHLHNPAKEVAWQSWKNSLLNEAPDLQLSFTVIENKRVTAYIFLHPINNEHYEIGWVGQQGNTDLLVILKEQLKRLREKGIKTVEFEVDTTDYNAWQFAEILDLNKKLSWNSYILR
ncbi:hypothetical protein MKY51_07770 [Solibacillus sp. FSL R5-0691]|uniref:hypothetical protein n=1 Tax=Solibacillus sp. FSL R5-0691 TaxID=2921653 RepID=UPI0030CDE231